MRPIPKRDSGTRGLGDLPTEVEDRAEVAQVEVGVERAT
jgi:hypothetical protein